MLVVLDGYFIVMVSIIFSISFIIASAVIDKEALEYSYIYNHSSRFIQRSIFFLCLALYSYTGALGGILLFAALFDGVLNKIRGLDLMHLGNTAKWDKFFNTKPLLYICVKVICLFSGIYLSII